MAARQAPQAETLPKLPIELAADCRAQAVKPAPLLTCKEELQARLPGQPPAASVGIQLGSDCNLSSQNSWSISACPDTAASSLTSAI